MRRIVLGLSLMAAALLLACGVALADHLANRVQCPTDQYGCYGTEQSDHIYGTEGPDDIYAFGGDDQVDAFGGDDYVDGGQGNDTLYGGDGWDSLDGEFGNDKLFGGTGRDYLSGYAGDDFLHGGSEADVIYGDMGRDQTAVGRDQIRGGSGSDRIDTGYYDRNGFRISDGVVDTVDCGSGTDTVYFEKGSDKINANCEIKKPYR